VVLTGSADEYGGQPGPLHEELPLLPDTPYGITKVAATRLAQVMARSEGCSATVLRPFSVYGPGQPAAMFVAQAVHCAVSGETFRMTHGRQRRDLVFVSDVVQALLAAAEADEMNGEVINIGSGQAWALCDVARLIWRLCNSEAPLEIGGRPAPEVELHDTWADITMARKRLGWEPRVDLESGLRATIEWARRERRGREQACPAG
jgi:nucleoside-diphosphate-sugar epimerase